MVVTVDGLRELEGKLEKARIPGEWDVNIRVLRNDHVYRLHRGQLRFRLGDELIDRPILEHPELFKYLDEDMDDLLDTIRRMEEDR